MLEPLGYLYGLERIPLNEVNACKHTQLRGRGIYAIFVESNNKIYIGSASKSFLRRFIQHRSKLNRGVHHTAGLQNAVNKYGLSCLSFAIVEILNTSKREEFLVHEQKWIDSIPSAIKLNICLVAGVAGSRPYPEDLKKEQSKYMKALCKKEPERVQKMIDGTKEWMKNPDNKEKRKQQAVKNFALSREKVAKLTRTPERRLLASMQFRKLWESPSHRELVSNTMKQEWANPEVRQKRCESLRKVANTPKRKEEATKHFKNLFKDPEFREKNREHLIKVSRKNAQKTGERTKALWANQDYKQQVTQSIHFTKCSNNDPSIIISPDQVKYVTDSITQFAKKFKLLQTSLNETLRGRQAHHKKWTGYKLTSWADVPDDAIRVLWGEHPDLPEQKPINQPCTPIQLRLNF